jgi:hypothetical protein
MHNRVRVSLQACTLAILAGCGAFSSPESSQRARADMMRGGELYRTHCHECHTSRVHWRDQRLVRSWDDLRYQVTRWQKIAGQNWSREDVDDVAAYLNRTFYEVPCTLPGCGGPSAHGEVPRLAQER